MVSSRLMVAAAGTFSVVLLGVLLQADASNISDSDLALVRGGSGNGRTDGTKFSCDDTTKGTGQVTAVGCADDVPIPKVGTVCIGCDVHGGNDAETYKLVAGSTKKLDSKDPYPCGNTTYSKGTCQVDTKGKHYCAYDDGPGGTCAGNLAVYELQTTPIAGDP